MQKEQKCETAGSVKDLEAAMYNQSPVCKGKKYQKAVRLRASGYEQGIKGLCTK